MDSQSKRELLQIDLKYRTHVGGWTAMIVIGAIILTSLGVPYTTNYSSSTYMTQVDTMIIVALLCLSFVIGGAANIGRLKKLAIKNTSNAISHANLHATQDTGEKITWGSGVQTQSRIPSSAFIPAPQGTEIPMPAGIPSSAFIPASQNNDNSRQSRIPSNAFIPASWENQNASKNPKGRNVPSAFTKPIQNAPNRICNYCGDPIPSSEESRFCPNCGHPV